MLPEGLLAPLALHPAGWLAGDGWAPLWFALHEGSLCSPGPAAGLSAGGGCPRCCPARMAARSARLAPLLVWQLAVVAPFCHSAKRRFASLAWPHSSLVSLRWVCLAVVQLRGCTLRSRDCAV